MMSDTIVDRQTDIDCLRILATFSVMILHISSSYYLCVDVETFEWNVLNFYDGIVRWTVPVFVMISGALFLNGNQSIGRIFKKNILRITTAFIFWSTLYALDYFITNHCDIKTVIIRAIKGHYHMWFLFMLVGLYIIVPLLRKMVSSIELTKYFLILSLIFTFVLPRTIVLISIVSKEVSTVAGEVLGNVNFYFTLGYVCYFVCGYYLRQIDLNRKEKIIFYVLGICGLVVTVVFNKLRPDGTFYGNFSINVMLTSLSIFIFAKSKLKLPNVKQSIVIKLGKLSKYSFGAYLVHVLIIDKLDNIFGFNALSFNPIISVPIIGVIVFIISFVISGILNHIPVINKYIV